MLSRIAENIYWLARYLERAESIARIVNATDMMLMDAPPSLRQEESWAELMVIAGCHQDFAKSGLPREDQAMVHFLLGAEDNPASLRNSLEFARENLRTTRDVFPKKVWEYLNEMYLAFRDAMAAGYDGSAGRYLMLDRVIQDCQKITGALFSTMSRDSAFEFFRMGQNLERADMTTRILAVGPVSATLQGNNQLLPFLNARWLAVLRGVSGEQMYRRHRHPQIRGDWVVDFLLRDREFPRACCFCLNVVDQCLLALVRNEAPRDSVTEVAIKLRQAEAQTLQEKGELAVFVDLVQVALGEVHNRIEATYFRAHDVLVA